VIRDARPAVLDGVPRTASTVLVFLLRPTGDLSCRDPCQRRRRIRARPDMTASAFAFISRAAPASRKGRRFDIGEGGMCIHPSR
jgi:hypothetical protein